MHFYIQRLKVCPDHVLLIQVQGLLQSMTQLCSEISHAPVSAGHDQDWLSLSYCK